MTPPHMQTFTYDIRPVMDHSASNMPAAVRRISQEAAIPQSISTERRSELEIMQGSVSKEESNKPFEDLSKITQPVVLDCTVADRGQDCTDMEHLSQETGTSGIRGFELRLVLEFCDCGNLRQALDQVRAIIICKPDICVIW